MALCRAAATKTACLSLAPSFSWVWTNRADASRFNGFNARGKPLKQLDFLSTPDARLKPRAGENQLWRTDSIKSLREIRPLRIGEINRAVCQHAAL
jgi:hypothetical protein